VSLINVFWQFYWYKKYRRKGINLKFVTNKKTIASTIALILMLIIGLQMLLIPSVTAHTPAWGIPSFAYVVAKPDPVGVGQRVMVYMWVDLPMPSAAITNDIRRHDYSLTIVKPDGTTETQNFPLIDDTTGVQMYPYTPNQVGTYTLNFKYAGQTYTWSGTYNNDKFLPADATTTFVVQEEPLPAAIETYPHPTEYWTRPIEGENTGWFAIASNWLNGPFIRSGATSTGGAGYGRFQSDGIGPNSAHIMWTKPLQDGGVVGGSTAGNNGATYYMGGSYNVRFSGAIVMYGRLYYQESYGNSGGGGMYKAIDLRTGEDIWTINATAAGGYPSFGYLYDFDTGNQHGVLPEGLLFTSNFARAYDPSTGVLTTMNVTSVPSGTEVAGPKGEILRLVLNSANKWLAQWNSSKVVGAASGNAAGIWYSGTVNASQASRYDWNVTIPSLGGGTWSIFRDVLFDDMLLLTQGSLGAGPRTNGVGANITAISLKPGSIGQVLWSRYYPPAPNNVTRTLIAISAEAGTFVAMDKETMTLIGYSLTNGNEVWTTTSDLQAWDTLRDVALSAYGNLYRAGHDGILYCYDMSDGNLLWTYGNGGEGNSTYAGLSTSYGHYPIFVDVIADGKVYLGTTEHSPDSPWYKDAQYRCINATTGEEIWTLRGWGSGMYVGQTDIVADGFFVYLNCYDMQIYCVGKGPSQMTIDAPAAGLTLGQSVVIRVTVTDIAAGTKQDEQSARFPNGVPAVSDASQGKWMDYVYMQKPRPTDVTGVPVVMSVVDANGNYREIGAVTSDADGFYSLNWTPDIEGKYTVYASFAGSESYWASHAVTAFSVDAAPVTPTPQPTQQPSMADLYFVPAIAGLFVFVAIIGALIIIVLRKRP